MALQSLITNQLTMQLSERPEIKSPYTGTISIPT
jgi:hypothetical protein